MAFPRTIAVDRLDDTVDAKFQSAFLGDDFGTIPAIGGRRAALHGCPRDAKADRLFFPVDGARRHAGLVLGEFETDGERLLCHVLSVLNAPNDGTVALNALRRK